MNESNNHLDHSENLYSQVSALLTSARANIRTAVNTAMVQTYWHIGRLIIEEEQRGEEKAEYGKALITLLSKRLTTDFGKGFGTSNLNYFRQFYLYFPILHPVRGELQTDPIRHALSDESTPQLSADLSWTHYRHLLKVKDPSARLWYMNEAADQNWSTRALERQINSLHYERLLSSKEKLPVQQEAAQITAPLRPQDILRDPYVLEFLQLAQDSTYTEEKLESTLISQLQHFLLELGSGFSFVARQKRVNLDGEHFYIDLVFYNYQLKCFVLIDLKLGKLTHQDIGQIDTYVRLYEDQYRATDDNPTIGLILCSEKNEAIARYSVLAEGKQVFASKYQLLLPSEEELATELQREIDQLQQTLPTK